MANASEVQKEIGKQPRAANSRHIKAWSGSRRGKNLSITQSECSPWRARRIPPRGNAVKEVNYTMDLIKSTGTLYLLERRGCKVMGRWMANQCARLWGRDGSYKSAETYDDGATRERERTLLKTVCLKRSEADIPNAAVSMTHSYPFRFLGNLLSVW